MSNLEQAKALRLLMAARELLTDSLASDDERRRLAEDIRRFVEHEPIDADANPVCGRCALPLSLHEVPRGPIGIASPLPDCPKGGGVFIHAPTVKR